jgi:hypothetical protein
VGVEGTKEKVGHIYLRNTNMALHLRRVSVWGSERLDYECVVQGFQTECI